MVQDTVMRCMQLSVAVYNIIIIRRTCVGIIISKRRIAHNLISAKYVHTYTPWSSSSTSNVVSIGIVNTWAVYNRIDLKNVQVTTLQHNGRRKNDWLDCTQQRHADALVYILDRKLQYFVHDACSCAVYYYYDMLKRFRRRVQVNSVVLWGLLPTSRL